MKLPAALLLLALSAAPIRAQEAWPDLRAMLYEDRPMQEAGALITTELPTRTDNDLRTPISAHIRAPEGHALREITLVIDNNPMPVSAVFALAKPQPEFFFEVTTRINRGTPVHIIAETDAGALFVHGQDLKTSGTGACAAPPGTDPEKALAELGQMRLAIDSLPALQRLRNLGRGGNLAELDIDLRHPSHSGLQKDQITLLYIPFRYVETLDVALDTAPYLSMTGSISLSENPGVSISIPAASQQVEVTMTDTEGTVTTAQQALSGS